MNVLSGTAVLTTGSFETPNAGGVLQPTDPATITLKFAFGASAPTVYTYPSTGVSRVSTGVYSATIDTSSYSGNGTVVVEWIGTGSCTAVNTTTFDVWAPPL